MGAADLGGHQGSFQAWNQDEGHLKSGWDMPLHSCT